MLHSHHLQRAVSNCLPPLMGPLSAQKEVVDGLVSRLLNTLAKGKTFGERWVKLCVGSGADCWQGYVCVCHFWPLLWCACLGHDCLPNTHTLTHIQHINTQHRRGAAFGLAGVVKGLGLMAMKNCGIMDSLKASVEDKKDPAAREVRRVCFVCEREKMFCAAGCAQCSSLSKEAYQKMMHCQLASYLSLS